MNVPTILCIMGPTASGKSDLAYRLAEKYPIEIISVDSAQVYRGMDIGTAKPSQEIQEKISHHLIDIIDIHEVYSAADFCRDATIAIEAVLSRGNIPVLVGGTMLYFKALQQGLSALPEANLAVRTQIEEEAKIMGWEALHEKLKSIDPESAARIHPNDPQRIGRALEVYYLTGKPLSAHFTDDTLTHHNFNYYNIGLFPQDRACLHHKIEQRFHHMLSQGWIEETENLLKKLSCNNESSNAIFVDYPSMRMVGYKQILDYLYNKIDKKTMIEHGIIATRQLAKRQMTWLRQSKHWPNMKLLEPWKEEILYLNFLKKWSRLLA